MDQRVIPEQETGSLSVASRTIVLRDRVVTGTIHIENGVIVAVEEDYISPQAHDLGEDILIPGLVELHTDHLEPHFAPRPKVHWDPVSAVFSYDAQIAASGITTVFDSLRAGRDADRNALSSGLELLGRAIEQAKSTGLLRADHHTHLRCEICSDNVLEEALSHVDEFDVRLISLMDHTPGARQFRDEEKLRIYYRGKASKTDAELDAYFAERKSLHAKFHDIHRPALIEMATSRGIAMASHDDTTVSHVVESVQAGVSIAEFPTTIEAAEASHKAGLAVLMGAPNVVRGGSHSGNVSAIALAEAGYLDILSSDYVPSSLIDGAFALRDVQAVGGLAGAIRLVTHNPAKATGMADRGAIAAGLRGDLVRVRLIGNRPIIVNVFRQGLRVA